VTTPTRSVSDNINQSRDVSRELQDSYSKSLTDVRTAVLSADQFRIMLSALKQQNGISIVSNPKIIVANEETATIHIGENEPNIKGTVTPGQQGQANSITYSLDGAKPYFEFGISLDVTPTINNASNITVRIKPTLSRFVRNKVTPDNNSFPVEATKTIKTVFSLDDGKTAAIGGLTETQDREVTKKIPLLGDLPLIGKWLFSHTHTQKSQQETIIFVTVGIASPGSIQRNEGLPEDAELVQRLILAKQANKTEREASMAKAKVAAEAKAARDKKPDPAGEAVAVPE
jgi:type II secretory pathway component GspD/PulD (secretin)